MEPLTLENELSELMAAHQVPIHVEGEWVVPFGKLPAIRATWYPRLGRGLLEVEVLLEDRRVIVESFAGFGEGREGIGDALHNFCVNSFHVLLASLWGLSGSDQVSTERWTIGEKEYAVFVGNLGTRGTHDANVVIPRGFFEAMEKAVKSEILGDGWLWFRCFFGNVSGDHSFEALVNNEVWESGLAALRSLPWTKPDGYFSVRLFLMLIEATQIPDSPHPMVRCDCGGKGNG
ncbi:MAG: hypothetical protein IPK50_08640 [Fibrobacterota bacterium]|nr:MAG: hypothetical protein IPK50_08640 [Fibrobacterota bacterium]